MIVFPSMISPLRIISSSLLGVTRFTPVISSAMGEPTSRSRRAQNRVIVSFVNPGEV